MFCPITSYILHAIDELIFSMEDAAQVDNLVSQNTEVLTEDNKAGVSTFNAISKH